MILELKQLIDSLRDELIEYGQSLTLLQQQRHCIVASSSDELLENLEEISSQIERIAELRGKRESLRQELASLLGQPPTLTFRQLTELIPAPYRPLLQSLVEELNEVLSRSQAQLLENNFLLRRLLARKPLSQNRINTPSLTSLAPVSPLLNIEPRHKSSSCLN